MLEEIYVKLERPDAKEPTRVIGSIGYDLYSCENVILGGNNSLDKTPKSAIIPIEKWVLHSKKQKSKTI